MAFYTTSNGNYGGHWISTDGSDPKNNQAKVSTYRDVANKARSHKTELKLLKTRIMMEKEVEDIETGAPPVHAYDPCVPQPKPQSFPVAAEEVKYPKHGLNGHENPIYTTSNRNYGRLQPDEQDIPPSYHPIDNKFTKAFIAERVPDTTLNTFKTPSRVHHAFDS